MERNGEACREEDDKEEEGKQGPDGQGLYGRVVMMHIWGSCVKRDTETRLVEAIVKFEESPKKKGHNSWGLVLVLTVFLSGRAVSVEHMF
jgi:hypothetical protein